MLLPMVLLRSTRILLPAILLPALVWAQHATLGPTLTQVVTSGQGVARRCSQGEYGTGVGARFTVPVLGRSTTLEVAGRGHWVDRGAECDAADFLPPPDGTYVEDDRVNLLSRSFITTDVRLATRLDDALHFAVGVGNAWRESHNLPYLVLAAGIPVLQRPDIRISLEGDWQLLRVTSDRFQRTYLDFELVAEESLGRVHQWSHALSLGLSLEFPLSGVLQSEGP